MTEKGSESLPFEPPEQENIRLREENARLRRLLAVHSIPIPQLSPENRPPTKTVETASPVDKEERARKRIALFRSLFRGREDVYARRWKNDDGRSGYVPAAVKDWKAINKSRPEERKKVDQKTRKFLPVTDAVIENHLLGKEAVGVYPLLSDETCWFLAADFDKKTWEYDAQAFLETCQELSVPAALERSRSGNGGHIWIFFDRALSAITARKLGCLILTRTMERRHQLGLDSYDRFFPFTKLLLGMRARFLRFPKKTVWFQPVAGGLLVGLMGLFVPQVLGVGYGYVGDVLNGRMALNLMVLLLVLKLITVTTSYASGNAGGIFGPALFIGAMLGGTVGTAAHHFLPAYTATAGAYALVGMGAVFAGIVRAPMTSVLMIFEMTQDYAVIVPLMIANLVSLFIASRLQREPIYEALAVQDGIHLPSAETRQ